ncbi:MAG: rubrerythrin family protein [Lachnospiraceae bacterium]|jgi:rubrerythrin|nr:rubrerythrin family protein [Lachnospiraceae bacterium]
MNLRESETRKNLLRAFAGESQARNRYTMAAGKAKELKLQAIQQIFLFTADQEKEHAEIFYKHLKELNGENLEIDGTYPIEVYDDALTLLRAARHNEYEEYENVYPAFAKTAQEEGFLAVAASFRQIAQIEKIHGDRFGHIAMLMEKNELFQTAEEEIYMCLNCGHIYTGKKVPESCPVCKHDRGYYIRIDMAPFTKGTALSL